MLKIPNFLKSENLFRLKETKYYGPGIFNYSLFFTKIPLYILIKVIIRKIISRFVTGKEKFPIEQAGVSCGINIYHRIDLNGEGFNLVFDYLRAYNQSVIKPQETILEVGCGPGYLGFAFLSLGLCKNLILVDINPHALEVVKKTIDVNNLTNVKYYLSDGLTSVPDNCCDLIISNPVHFDQEVDRKNWRYHSNDEIIARDQDWKFHKNIYSHAKRVLKSNGSMLIQENQLAGNNTQLFEGFIEKNGGKLISEIKPNILTPESPMYYLYSKFNTS